MPRPSDSASSSFKILECYFAALRWWQRNFQHSAVSAQGERHGKSLAMSCRESSDACLSNWGHVELGHQLWVSTPTFLIALSQFMCRLFLIDVFLNTCIFDLLTAIWPEKKEYYFTFFSVYLVANANAAVGAASVAKINFRILIEFSFDLFLALFLSFCTALKWLKSNYGHKSPRVLT